MCAGHHRGGDFGISGINTGLQIAAGLWLAANGLTRGRSTIGWHERSPWVWASSSVCQLILPQNSRACLTARLELASK